MTTFSILADAKLYVGTYSKYNNGSIQGEWLTLGDYNSKEDFLTACASLHSDEEDPELMFQDFEGFPKDLYSECSLFDFWALAENLEANYIENFELYAEFCSHFGYDIAEGMEQFQEAYSGDYSNSNDPESDFAYQVAEDHLDGAADFIKMYFDYDKFQRDLFITDYTEIKGHIFRNL